MLGKIPFSSRYLLDGGLLKDATRRSKLRKVDPQTGLPATFLEAALGKQYQNGPGLLLGDLEDFYTARSENLGTREIAHLDCVVCIDDSAPAF